MVFTSAVFLGVFLPLLLAVYFLANEKARPYVLLVFSLLFYAWGEPTAIVVMLALMVLNYMLSLGMSAAGEREKEIVNVFSSMREARKVFAANKKGK